MIDTLQLVDLRMLTSSLPMLKIPQFVANKIEEMGIELIIAGS